MFTDGKSVAEASQTSILAVRDKERPRGEGFAAAQFLVELRMCILPTVRSLWESDLIEKGSSDISDKLIEVLKSIAMADNEAGALKRSEQVSKQITSIVKQFQPNLEILVEECMTYDRDLVIEALYRCNNSHISSSDYLREAKATGLRLTPPSDAIAPTATSRDNSRPRSGTSSGSATPEEPISILMSGILPLSLIHI